MCGLLVCKCRVIKFLLQDVNNLNCRPSWL
uniref:Uncharacterized protein n=1 Tax=Arundo donax TaxID=35708 RepID=A0A0A8Y6W4_ARUDO